MQKEVGLSFSSLFLKINIWKVRKIKVYFRRWDLYYRVWRKTDLKGSFLLLVSRRLRPVFVRLDIFFGNADDNRVTNSVYLLCNGKSFIYPPLFLFPSRSPWTICVFVLRYCGESFYYFISYSYCFAVHKWNIGMGNQY